MEANDRTRKNWSKFVCLFVFFLFFFKKKYLVASASLWTSKDGVLWVLWSNLSLIYVFLV